MKDNLKNTKAILLDIDNTLIDFYKSAFIAVKKAFSICKLEFKDSYFDILMTINDKLWIEIEKGKLDRDGLHKIRFNLLFKEIGIDFDGELVEKEFLNQLFYTAVAVDGATHILEYLSKKYSLYAASNAIYLQQINRLSMLGMKKYFKKLFVSEKLGFQKPTKEFFDCCFLEMGSVLPSETVMIGDSLSADIDGGIKYGLSTIWFNPNKKPIKDNIIPDYCINSLLELKNIL